MNRKAFKLKNILKSLKSKQHLEKHEMSAWGMEVLSGTSFTSFVNQD